MNPFDLLARIDQLCAPQRHRSTTKMVTAETDLVEEEEEEVAGTVLLEVLLALGR